MTEAPHFRYPKKDELIGYVTQLLGFGRMYVKCADGKIRLCQVKGSLSRYLWIGEGDLVLVKPWEVEKDKKGDILYRYDRGSWADLKTKGFFDDSIFNA